MLIAHVITRLLRAGSEENTVATCLAQAKAGHEVLLVHGNEWHPIHKSECEPAVKVIEIPELVHQLNLRRDLAAIRALHSLFRNVRPTVVHTHQSKAGIVGRVAARLAQVPVIVHGVHIVPFLNVGRAKKAIYLAAERGVSPFTKAFINVSEGTQEAYLAHAVGGADRHFVVHSGIEMSRFRDASFPEGWRTLVGISKDSPKPPIVLMLAALEPRKRHVEFIEAFERVIKRVPEARLLLAGEGSERAAVEAIIDKKVLGERVRMLGFFPHPERLIALADVTVLTSMREGLPRVAVQSLAGGKPVVIADIPGIAEIVQTGVNGIVTPSDDVGAAADALAGLLCNPHLLGQMQHAAAETDISSWSVESMCISISAIYERLVHDHTAIPRARA